MKDAATPTPSAARPGFWRRIADMLSGSPGVANPYVRERLLQTILDRRFALLVGLCTNSVIAVAALHLIGACWAMPWLLFDIGLVIVRLGLIRRSVGQSAAAKEAIIGWLMLLGFLWSLALGIVTALCLISGNVALITLAAITAASAISIVTSRNAATPRHGALLMLSISLPFALGAAFSPAPGMWIVSLVVMPWALSALSMLKQNYDVTIRHIRDELNAREIAETDTLTGLNSRMFYTAHMHRIAQNGGIAGASLLCIDLDGFKAVNDTHGHAAGDRLLAEAARRIGLTIRLPDLAFRLGGDEFVVLLVGAGADGCDSVAQRIIRAMSFPIKVEPGVAVRVGVSIGSACAADADPPGDADALFKAADRALYVAKSGGKGRHVRAMDTHRAAA